MPYPPEHREQTRSRILDAAACLFARQGFDAVSIDDLMEAAGLTRGAFYHHFATKGEVYAAAIPHATGNSPLARAKLEEASPAQWFEATVARYLSREHLEAAPAPCPLAFLVTDVGRREGPVREAYTRGYKGLLALLRRQLRDSEGTAAEKAALAVSALMIGGVAVARAVDDDATGEHLLAACRETARALLGIEEGEVPEG